MPTTTPPDAPALRVARVAVRPTRVVCDLELSAAAPALTSPELLERVRRDFPDIDGHACVNDRGRTFGAVADHTSVAHLFEHLVIDLQARPPAPADAVFCGTTVVHPDGRGARVEVGFADDLAALGAVRDACAYLNRLLA